MLDPKAHAILDQVSADVPWPLVEHFATFPRWKPQDVAQAADEIAKRLGDLGVPVEMHDANLYLSIPYEASVEIDGVVLAAKPLAYARSCPEGLTGTLVHVPSALAASTATFYEKNRKNEADAAEHRIKGKIVLTDGFANPQKVLEFQQKGAIGVIAVNPGVDRHWGICSSIWGTPDLDGLPRKPKIPVAAVSNPDGNALIAVAQMGGQVTLRTRLEEGWFRSPVPVVTIAGSIEPDKFVLLHGHYDSWDVGVGDNATGNAAMLEIARVLWANRDGLRRSVRIAWWPGHSTGRYAGSAWFADRFALDLDENCVAQVNCDSPGCRWADVFEDIAWMSEAEGFCKDIIHQVTGQKSHGERPLRAGDYSFNNIGLTGFFMLSSTMTAEKRKEMDYYTVGGCGGNIAWHTENDTLEIADCDILLRDIKVYLGAVLAVANAPILPFDWRATLREFEVTLAKLTAGAGQDADALAAVVTDLAALSLSMDRFYAAIAAGTVPQARANTAIQALARILVPLNFTRGPRFTHDPALPVPALPLLSIAPDIAGMAADQQGFARTQLVRGVNRTCAALRCAAQIVQD
jgi:N-acetylated-alpha-linked acidic dipeptidase